MQVHYSSHGGSTHDVSTSNGPKRFHNSLSSVGLTSTPTLTRLLLAAALLLGSHAVWADLEWQNYRVQFRMQSSDNDNIGLMFRYQDPLEYYRFLWNGQGGLRELHKVRGGTLTVLATDNVPFATGVPYEIEIAADGGQLSLSIDGQLIFSVFDADIPDGGIAFYNRANTNSYYDNLVVTDLDTQTTITTEDFEASPSLDRFLFVNEGNSSMSWTLLNGWLRESTNTYRNSDPLLRGTFALLWDSMFHSTVQPVRLVQPLSQDTQLSTGTPNDKRDPSIATNGSGETATVWVEATAAGDVVYLETRRANGTVYASNIPVSNTTQGEQTQPEVALSDNGVVWVVWLADYNGNGFYDVHAEAFYLDGTTAVAEFNASIGHDWQQLDPHVAVDAQDRPVVTWSDDHQLNSNYEIALRAFDALGNLRFSDAQVNTTSSGQQNGSSVAVDGAGNIFVSWSDHRNGNYDIYATVLNADGTPQVPEFRVNQTTVGHQRGSSIVASANGDFSIAFQSDLESNGTHEIVLGGFYADGTNRIDQQRLHVYPDGTSQAVDIEVLADGEIVVAWEHAPQGETLLTKRDVLFRIFNANGVPLTNSSVLTSQSDGVQLSPGIATQPGTKKFFAVWQDDFDLDGTHTIWTNSYQILPDEDGDGNPDPDPPQTFDIYRGDVNGDGFADIYMQSIGPGNHYVLLGSAAGTYAEPAIDNNVDSSGLTLATSGVSVDDFDNDGADDILVQGLAAGEYNVLIKGTSDGTTPTILEQFNTFEDNDASLEHAIITMGDVNGDGYADFSITWHNTGSCGAPGSDPENCDVVYINAGTGAFEFESNEPPPPNPGGIPPADPESDAVGVIAGDFRVDESGAATYSVPIVGAPGIAGVAPQVALAYSSQGSNGLVGQGWSIGGMSAITRCRQTRETDGQNVAIDFSSTDRFCLDGQRLVVVSGSYGAPNSEYRTEIDAFTKVVALGGSSG